MEKRQEITSYRADFSAMEFTFTNARVQTNAHLASRCGMNAVSSQSALALNCIMSVAKDVRQGGFDVRRQRRHFPSVAGALRTQGDRKSPFGSASLGPSVGQLPGRLGRTRP